MSSDSPVSILYDSSGNPIEVVSFGGKYYVGNSMLQNVTTSVNNSDTDQIAAGGSFTGLADSTFGVAGIQVNVFSDQPMTVEVQQSMNSSDWDIVDSYDIQPNIGDGRTTQATAEYVRVVVYNLGPVITTEFRIQTVLCPTVEALPRGLTPNGRLRLSRKMKGFFPSPDNFTDMGQHKALTLDGDRNLVTRGVAFTDEQSFRDDFTQGNIYKNLTGTCYFRNGQVHVVGDGTSFLTEVSLDRHIRLSTDGDDHLVQVADVISDTDLTLAEAYSGTTGNGTGTTSLWVYDIGSGSAITESGSEIVLSSGTTNGTLVQMIRGGDYPPYTFKVLAKVSQRITDQQILLGFADGDYGSEEKQALIVFDGTDDTKVKLRTSFAGTDVEETEVTIPYSGTSDTYAEMRLEVYPARVILWVNDVKLATHTQHIPGPYDSMDMRCAIKNTNAGVSDTTLTLDYLFFSNYDRLEIGSTGKGDPLEVVAAPATTGETTSVSAQVASTQILADNFSRLGATVFNDSSAILYLKLGIGASTTSFTVKMLPYDYYELPFGYTGRVFGYWASATGNARITELV